MQYQRAGQEKQDEKPQEQTNKPAPEATKPQVAESVVAQVSIANCPRGTKYTAKPELTVEVLGRCAKSQPFMVTYNGLGQEELDTLVNVKINGHQVYIREKALAEIVKGADPVVPETKQNTKK